MSNRDSDIAPKIPPKPRPLRAGTDYSGAAASDEIVVARMAPRSIGHARIPDVENYQAAAYTASPECPEISQKPRRHKNSGESLPEIGMARADELTDEQWLLIEKHFPKPSIGQRGRRPRDAREVMNGVLWIMRTGSPWHELPRRFPPYQTCHRHFEQWLRSGVLQRVINTLSRHLREASKAHAIELPAGSESLRRGSYAVSPDEKARLRDSWLWQTAMALRSPYASRLRTRMKTDALHARATAQQAPAA